MTKTLVNYELVEETAILHMDDGRANALGHDMIEALYTALGQAESEAKAVILTGREKRFSAGFDLSVMNAGPDAAQALVLKGARLFLHLYQYPLPVLSACNGHALAAGALILLASDYRVGPVGDYKIGLNEVAIGMTTPLFLLALARDRLEKRWFEQAALQSRLFDGTGAREAGYLDEAVPAETVMETTMTHAARLGQLSQPAFKISKRKAHNATIRLVKESLYEEASIFGAA